MKTYRFVVQAHEEIDIKANNKEEADIKAQIAWEERFKGMFGEVEYIKEILPEPVDFMTAVESGKKVKVEHEYITEYILRHYEAFCDLSKYQRIKEIFKFIATVFSSHHIKDIMVDGKWYIED